MDDNPEQINYFAATDSRGVRKPFGIKAIDRARHMYVIGKTGMGKSTLLENMAIQDIQNGNGISFIDPHGSTAEKLLDYVPENRIKDVIYFAPFDMDHPVAFNVMEDVGYDKRHLVVSGLLGAFKKIWVDNWSARMEYILTNTLLALLEYPDSTLLDVNKMLINKAFRAKVVDRITDPIVKSFWAEEFANYGDRYTQDATPAIQNKVGQFTSNPLIRNIVGQPKSSFDVRKIMDEKKIFIANLSKGRMGEQNADLIGSMLTTKIYLAAMSRAGESTGVLNNLPPHYFYVDEFQSVANDSFADILSEARKYKLALTLAHQYVEQMEENVRNAVFGNVGTTIMFRVGPLDAELFEALCKPKFTAEDLVNLGKFQIYLMLMIDGVGSQPFSAITLPSIEEPEITFRKQINENSQKTYGRPQQVVEKTIRERNEIEDSPQKRSERALQKQQEKEKSQNGGRYSGGGSNGGRNKPRRELNRHDKTISLKDLRSKMKEEDRGKEKGKKEQLNDLRSALKSAISSHKKGEPKKEESKEEKPKPPKQAPSPPKPEEKKNEISEEELKRILNVEKNDSTG
ncbi:hypothetical protein CL631_02675 [bacterium]|nr:hypothetical protein [bacterium]|tara:strand:- start:52636 stop:54348 length:1713 start_codon:yes stop_codon:yes gene_type:complete